MVRSTNKRSGREGVTLIELMVALALVGVVMAVAGTMLLQAYANEAAYREQNTAQQNARTAADTVADDLRGAKKVMITLAVPGVTGGGSFPRDSVFMNGTPASSTPQSIVDYQNPLYFNIYDDTGAERRVRYWLQIPSGSTTGNLRREIVSYVDETSTPGAASTNTAGTVIARNIAGFTAAKPGITSTNPQQNNYNLVRIIITATDGSAFGTSSVTLRSDVLLRNNLL